MIQKFADLHLHTAYSDGSYLPDELVASALGAGLDIIAVTDHDSIIGVEPAIEAAAGAGLEVIAGTELSVRFNEEEIHVVGLFVDIHSETLVSSLDELRRKRQMRIIEIAEKLSRLQIRIDPHAIIQKVGRGTVGRLHVAEQLLQKGITTSIAESFWKYLGDKAAAFVPKPEFPLEDACRMIHEAHGVAVLAHPGAVPDPDRIRRMADAGLDAIEAFYPSHDEAVTRAYLDIAKRFDLGVAGGSDCHGEMKDQVLIGRIKIPIAYVDDLRKRAK